MATSYNLNSIQSMALNGSYYRQITNNQNMLTSFQTRVIETQATLADLQAKLRALQVQVLAALTPPVVVDNSTPINMVVNKDGSVTLSVG